jgi:predicted P-loop ATPase
VAAEDKLLEAATALSRGSAASEIDGLLTSLAAAALGRIGERRVLDEIKRRTRIPLSALVTQLGSHKQTLVPADRPSWVSSIVLSPSGEPCPIASNVLIALRQAPEWRSVVGFDEFHQRPVLLNKPPWANGEWKGGPVPFTDVDESRTLVWIQQAGIHCRIEAVRQALAIAIDDNRFHPVRDYLNRLIWDGTSRLDTWLTYYLGVEPIENYTGPVGVRWMISGAARIYDPGCLVKYCLVLEGRQDLKKSTALETLGSPWFTDDVAELGTKDSAMQVGNAWIVELSELDSVRRAHISSIKAFISRKKDQFRKPFGRYVIEQPRQCIMAGTVNPSTEYLADDTGGVRFWPVACESIDIEALRQDRDQLWAEAVARYKKGEPWWIDVDEIAARASVEQERRFTVDSWQENIQQWLAEHPSLSRVTVAELLSGVFSLAPKDHERSHQTRAGIILRRLKWTMGGRSDEDGRPRFYVRPARG